MSKKSSNPRGDAMPTEGFGVAVDGKIKSSWATSEEAFKVGLGIKQKFPIVQVMIYEAASGTRTLVEEPAEETAT